MGMAPDDLFPDVPLHLTGHGPRPIAADDPFPDVPHEVTDAWAAWHNPRAVNARKRTAAAAAAAAGSQLADEENQSTGDTISHGALAAANAMDALGLSDEIRGAWGAAGAGASALLHGHPGDVVDATNRGYIEQRDLQREATKMAEDASPMASGWGQLAGTALPALATPFSSTGAAVANAARQGAGRAIAQGLGGGALFGALGGAGHAEGDVGDQLIETGKGAAIGAALGMAPPALATGAKKLLPAISEVPLSFNVRKALHDLIDSGAIESDAARARAGIANAGREGAAKALDAAAKVAPKLPAAAGAALGYKAGGGPGAAVGTFIGDQIAGGAGKAAGAKLTSAAERLRAGKSAAARIAAELEMQPLAADIGTQNNVDTSGLSLGVSPKKINADLAAMKERMGITDPRFDVGTSDVVAAQDASDPWVAALFDAERGGAPRMSSPPVPEEGPVWSPNGPRARDAVPLPDWLQPAPPSTLAAPDGSLAASAPPGSSTSPGRLRGPGPAPAPSTPQEASRADVRAQVLDELSRTTPMSNAQMGKLRIESSRADPLASPWSDSVDANGDPVFDVHGNEQLNPAVRQGWREAAARHAAPVEGGPSSTAGMLDEDAQALLGRGGRTKGGLQGSSAYHGKRNADLAAQSGNAQLAPDVQQSARDLLASSRTASPPHSAEALAGAVQQLPEPMRAKAIEAIRMTQGEQLAAKVRDVVEGVPSWVTDTNSGLPGSDLRSSTWKARENGEGVVSSGAERTRIKLEDLHRAADKLPRDRGVVLQTLLEANGIGDHDSAKADAAYARWKQNGRRGAKPTAQLGGLLDAFSSTKDQGQPSSLLEALDRELKTARTWRDVKPILPALAEALGVDVVRLPEDVEALHVHQDAEK